jgi:hypothetical protein
MSPSLQRVAERATLEADSREILLNILLNAIINSGEVTTAISLVESLLSRKD